MKKILSAFLSTVLLAVSIPTTAFAATEIDKEAVIEALMNQRDKIFASKVADEQLGLDTTDLTDELNGINTQLSQLGVIDLSTEEAMERFGENRDIMPYIDKPYSRYVDWTTYSTTYELDGDLYVVETLQASPNCEGPTNIWETGAVTISSNQGVQAGLLNVVEVAANKALSLVTSVGTVTKLVKSAYDYGKAYIKGLNGQTVITNISASYTYNCFTTVAFKFVKKYGQPDSTQVMSFVSTKAEVVLTSNFPTFTISGGVKHPDIVQGKEQITAIPPGYNSTKYAVMCFASIDSAPPFVYVDAINLTGMDGKRIASVSGMMITYPAQVIG